MTRNRSTTWHALSLMALLGASAPVAAQEQDNTPSPTLEALRDDATTRLFKLLGRNASWKPVATVSMDFQTFHTQGLVKVGETFFVSAVEVIEATQRNGESTDATYDFTLDRSVGAGRAWLFQFDATGHLLNKVELTTGSVFHPGGIDYDGRYLWVPVAEYRPNSHSHLYRVDPKTLEAKLVHSEDDHIGGLVHDKKRGTLHAVSWGSRRLYTFKLGRDGSVVDSAWTPNSAAYVDYQDCHQRGLGYMLCGGLTSYATPNGSVAFGGLELVDLWRNKPSHQVPVNVFVDEGKGVNPGLALTHNPFWVEPRGDGSLRFYFMPESDNQAELLIYDATPWVNRAQ